MNTISKDEAHNVALIIIEQLGGHRALSIMVGAKTYLSHTEGRGAVSFRFKGSRKVNYVKITLTPMDTYTLQFGRVSKRGYTVIETVEDIYNDNLRDVFSRVTGLILSVPLIKGLNA